MNTDFRHHGLHGLPDDSTGDDTASAGNPPIPSPDGLNPAVAWAEAASGSVLTTGAAQLAGGVSPMGVASTTAPIPVTGQTQAGGLIINVTYDSSVTALNTVGNAAYNPSLYAEYTGAVQSAVRFYQTTITSNLTLNINFGWGEVGGAPIGTVSIGRSLTLDYQYTYSQLRAAVLAADTTSAVQKAAAASLPATDPTGGALFNVSTSEAQALGLVSGYTSTAGSVGIVANASSFFWSQATPVNGQYDAVGLFEHEISEVLGRSATGGAGGVYTLLDMFRYTAANGASGAAAGSAAGVLNEPFTTGYSTTAAASAAAGLNSYSYFSYNGTTVTNQFSIPSAVANKTDVADWAATVPGDAFGYSAAGTVSAVSTTDLRILNVLGYGLVACFLPNTMIATPDGEVPVQSLAVGDMVSTQTGQARPVVWIGRGKALAATGRRGPATPVIVRKGALGDNVPNRDLFVTKGHALYLDGVLIPAEFLVNHRSVLWDDRGQEVTVYHIELATHDVLLANGAPAESYRDDGNRWLFQNGNDARTLPPQPPCAPVLTGGPIVDSVWRRLLGRSGPRPGVPVTDEPDLHLIANGRRVDGQRQRNGVYGFRLPPGVSSLRLVSRAGVPGELGLARDPRPLGVAIRRIVGWRGRWPVVIEADDPRLCQGFHAYEPDNGHRWTDGDAVLPEPLFVGGVGGLDIHVTGGVRYPLCGTAA